MKKRGIKIAISGKSGCGNSTVSKLTAERLGLRMINYTFHNIADERRMDFAELRRLAETDSSWDFYLDKKQLELAAEGNCVLGSRLAIWLLKDADLKVFLDAPPEVRAERIRKREGGDSEKVYRETIERDSTDHQRFLRLYNIDNEQTGFADIVINTADFTPEQIARQIADKAENLKK
ncbi:MAG: AAA family ATPase [Spirochaetales bacterium]|nr:AAA family ATPase [Spirochaetales bacterium]